MGQHEAGKHTSKGQKAAKAQPRMPKGKKKGTTAGGVYNSQNAKGGGILGRIFKKKG